jgi:hypothetical protein
MGVKRKRKNPTGEEDGKSSNFNERNSEEDDENRGLRSRLSSFPEKRKVGAEAAVGD